MTRPLGVGSPSPSPPATRSGRHFRPAAGRGAARDCRYGRRAAVPSGAGSGAGPVRSRELVSMVLIRSAACRPGALSTRRARAVGAGPEEGAEMRLSYGDGVRELGSVSRGGGGCRTPRCGMQCWRGAGSGRGDQRWVPCDGGRARGNGPELTARCRLDVGRKSVTQRAERHLSCCPGRWAPHCWRCQRCVGWALGWWGHPARIGVELGGL